MMQEMFGNMIVKVDPKKFFKNKLSFYEIVNGSPIGCLFGKIYTIKSAKISSPEDFIEYCQQHSINQSSFPLIYSIFHPKMICTNTKDELEDNYVEKSRKWKKELSL